MSLNDSAELLTVIKQRGTVPTNAGSWDDASLLRTATEVMRTWHVPMLVNAKGEYLVKETQMPCVVGQREYLISYRASAIRLLSLVGSDNVERPLTDMKPSEQSTIYADRGRQGTPLYFSFREGYVQLFPLPMTATTKLKILWHFRPSRLVLTSSAWQISAITTPVAGTTRLAFATTAPAALQGPVGTLFDVSGVRNPFTLKAIDAASTSLIGAGNTTVDFAAADIPADVAVGDWLSAAGFSAMPNVIEELHPAIALRTAAVAVGSRQSQLAQSLNAEAGAIEKNLLAGILAPRSKGNPQRLVQRRWMRR